MDFLLNENGTFLTQEDGSLIILDGQFLEPVLISLQTVAIRWDVKNISY